MPVFFKGERSVGVGGEVSVVGGSVGDLGVEFAAGSGDEGDGGVGVCFAENEGDVGERLLEVGGDRDSQARFAEQKGTGEESCDEGCEKAEHCGLGCWVAESWASARWYGTYWHGFNITPRQVEQCILNTSSQLGRDTCEGLVICSRRRAGLRQDLMT